MTDKTTNRDEWIRRYAARIMEKAAWSEDAAMMAANAGAEEYERNERAAGNAVDWSAANSVTTGTPEDLADEEMSYWTDDGE